MDDHDSTVCLEGIMTQWDCENTFNMAAAPKKSVESYPADLKTEEGALKPLPQFLRQRTALTLSIKDLEAVLITLKQRHSV